MFKSDKYEPEVRAILIYPGLNFERVVRYTGAGYDITTIHIDGVEVETFNLTTK
jgi:hypothetical protein